MAQRYRRGDHVRSERYFAERLEEEAQREGTSGDETHGDDEDEPCDQGRGLPCDD